MYLNTMDIPSRLLEIHNQLHFSDKVQLKKELPEQIMALYHVHPESSVLELGGSIGRNTCVINTILENKSNHVVIEPNPNERQGLEYNKQINNLEFQIEPYVLSMNPLYSRGWYTHNQSVAGSIKVDNITWQQLCEKYNTKFDTLVIDNEGNFVQNLKDFPNILDNIKLLIIEHDFHSQHDLDFFKNHMKSKGFTLVDKYEKTQPLGPGMNWSDGVIGDEIFVSVWKSLFENIIL